MKFSFRTYLMNDLFFLVSPTGWKDRELFYTGIGGSSTKNIAQNWHFSKNSKTKGFRKVNETVKGWSLVLINELS